MYKKLFTLSISILLLSGISYAQFSIDGEFRSRGIAENGFKTPAKKGADGQLSFDQRTRLLINFTKEKYSTRITLQDARVWGNEDIFTPTGPLGNSSSLGIYEAWVNMKLGEKSNIKIGRQEWNYNDMRILAWRNWWTSGLSYDGLLYQMKDAEKGVNIDLGLSYNNNGNATGISINNSDWPSGKLKTMNFLNIQKRLGEKTNGTLIFTVSGKEDFNNGNTNLTGTHALHIKHNTGKTGTGGFVASFSAYYQHGKGMLKGPNGDYRSISAYMITANAGFRTDNKKLELLLGMELMSGRDYTKTDSDYLNKRHSFDLLYSGRIPYYGGFLTHFVNQDSYKTGTKGGGYFDPSLKAKYNLDAKNTFEAGLFMPMLTTKVAAHTSINPETGKPTGIETVGSGNVVYWDGKLGTYLDLSYTHKFSKEIILKAGTSLGSVSDTKNQMVYGYKNSDTKELFEMATNYYSWVMLIVKPNFFKN
ncbi:MAG: hypothetical protein R3182_01030 [Draconibacterium sp.]|nr:hypothetical protein [Draconibacterium sp.]